MQSGIRGILNSPPILLGGAIMAEEIIGFYHIPRVARHVLGDIKCGNCWSHKYSATVTLWTFLSIVQVSAKD